MSNLETAVLEPDTPASAAIIWLHGLGADYNDFIPIVKELNLPAGHGYRFVFPNAPIQAVTLNAGMEMRAWYDIKGLTMEDREDADGIHRSVEAVYQLVEEQIALGIPSERIVLAGFSQGGAIAMHAALRADKPLAGLLALSSYLPLNTKFSSLIRDENKALPIMMAHGIEDPVVAIQWAEVSRTTLEVLGYKPKWHTYHMQHQVCMQEIQDISQWLQEVLT